MSTTVLTQAQNRWRDSIESSSTVGLAVRANGEERTKIILRNGTNIFNAGIPAPTAAPTAANAVGGSLTAGLYYAYCYVYVASSYYPLVDNQFTINGTLAPRGNPSSVISAVTTALNKKINVTITGISTASRPDIDTVWLFATGGYGTSAEAVNAATAGLCYWVKAIPNPGAITAVMTDDGTVAHADLIELDNFEAPTFQFCKFVDPYWWGIGNNPFSTSVIVTGSSMVITTGTTGKTPLPAGAGPDPMAVGTDYTCVMSIARAVTFSGVPAVNSTITLCVQSPSNFVLTFPTSYIDGVSTTTQTMLAGMSLLTWVYSGTVWNLNVASVVKWFDGRDGQPFTLSGNATGGFDGLGGFKFKWVTAYSATVTTDGTTPVVPTTVGQQNVTIQGPPTTLYRSKSRNPLSWGWTEVIGTLSEAQIWAEKVGGGIATALNALPNEPILKIDIEYPTLCRTYNLQAADNLRDFVSTKRDISRIYSVSANFSQFAATTQNGNSVLWGIDFKNYAILQCDGVTQVPISQAIPRLMRSLTKDKSQQLLAHGIYDSFTELNCIWVALENSPNLVDLLIYQHAPTGFWGTAYEKDVLCSATIQDSSLGIIQTFVGSQSGLYGRAFVEDVYQNWAPTSYGGITNLLYGTIATIVSANSLAIGLTTTDVTASNYFIEDDTNAPGMIGNWCLITDSNGENEVWCRIKDIATTTSTGDTLKFDRFIIRGDDTVYNEFPGALGVTAGWLFHVGVIECALRKFYDVGKPFLDKQLLEAWVTQQNVDVNLDKTTLFRYSTERQLGYDTQFEMTQTLDDNGDPTDTWATKQEIDAESHKSFTLEIINRGYTQWKILNMALKLRANNG